MLLVPNHHVVVPRTEELSFFMPNKILGNGTGRMAHVQTMTVFAQPSINLNFKPLSSQWVEIYHNDVRFLRYRYPTHRTGGVGYDGYNIIGQTVEFTRPISGRLKIICDTIPVPLPEISEDPATKGLIIDVENAQSYDVYEKRFTPARYASGRPDTTVNPLNLYNTMLTQRVGDSMYAEPLVLRQPYYGYVRLTSNRKNLLYVPYKNFQGYDAFTYTLITVHGQIGVPQVCRIEVYGAPLEPYILTVSDNTMVEGGNVVVTLDSFGFLNGSNIAYTITGAGINNADFANITTTGNFTVQAPPDDVLGISSITVESSWFASIEGDETFTLSINEDPSKHVNVTIVDVGYSLTSVPNINNFEGTTFDFILTTKLIPDLTLVPYQITGTGVTAADFTVNIMSGNFTVMSNTATISASIVDDLQLEGNETLTISLVDHPSITHTVIFQEFPVYAISPNTGTVMEGNTITFTVTTKNVPDATVLFYSVTGISVRDFVTNQVKNTTSIIGLNTFSFAESVNRLYLQYLGRYATQTELDTAVLDLDASVITLTQLETTLANSAAAGIAASTTRIGSLIITTPAASIMGSGTITALINGDRTTEGTENFTIQLRTTSATGPIVATGTLSIQDTSVNPVYAISPSGITASAGSSITYTVATSNVFDYTKLFWTDQGLLSATDFVDTVKSGSVSVVNNAAVIVRTLKSTLSSTLPKQIELVLRINSTTGNIVATASNVTVS